MVQNTGKEHARGDIILFTIGFFLTAIALIVSIAGLAIENLWMTLIGFGTLVGLILELIAIIRLRNVNEKFASCLWMIILSFLLALAMSIINIVNQDGTNETLITVVNVLNLVNIFVDAAISVYFVLGTNKLATENGKGMPKLTKTITFAYVVIAIIDIVFSAISYFTTISTNEVVANVFSIIVLVLLIIRSVGFVIFLLRAINRVK